MKGTIKLRSRYLGPTEVARAFRVAVADLYLASGSLPILGFEVADEHGQPIGRFEGYVQLIGDDTTPEQFVKRAREMD